MNNGLYFGANRVAFMDMEAINAQLPARPMREKPFSPDELKTMPWSPWGDDNLKPQQMIADIKLCASLTGIVGLKSRLAACEGLVPAIVKSSETGTRVIDKIVDDEEITEFLDASNHFFQTAGWMEDIIGMANGVCRWMVNKDGDKIAAFKRQDASEMRYEKRNKDGYVTQVYLSPEWKNIYSSKDNRIYTLPLLKEWAPWVHAKELMQAGKKEFVSTFRYPGRDEAYYSSPRWYAAYKWVKYVQAVPEIKAAGADNVMRPAWLVTIYKGFWQHQFENWDQIEDPKEKEAMKSTFFTEVDNKLNGKSNAGKNIYRTGELSMEFGKGMAFIEFEPMEGPKLDGAMLPDAAAGNSEIAFAEMMNLALIGGNQSAGPYTKNEGGSNIREASLFQIVITELERRYIKQLMNVPKYVNGWAKKYPGLEFIIPATALTTLDTGAGSKPITTGGVQPKKEEDGSTDNNNN
jgi:hypothetical protein